MCILLSYSLINYLFPFETQNCINLFRSSVFLIDINKKKDETLFHLFFCISIDSYKDQIY